MAFKLQPYREWRDAFDNEKVYTRRDMAVALREKEAAFNRAGVILGVEQLLPNDYSMMMQLVRVERSDNGIYIVVR